MGRQSIFVAAGDPSGDNAAGRLITELRQEYPDIELFGLGGPKLLAHGQEQFAGSSELAVLGFWEVAKRYFFFRRLMHRCISEIKNRRPSCVLLIDYPGFNIRLARRIAGLGVPVVYYIAPQVWAWGKKRVEEIRRLVDHLIVILPFEKEFFAGHDIRTSFVGHYLLEDMPEEYISSALPIAGHLALLPGSRPQEVERMLPVMVEAARKFNRQYGTKAVVAAVDNGFEYEKQLAAFADDSISIVYNNARDVIKDASLVVTASGTATLETGIIGRPMVVIYKTGFITYQIARRLVTLDTIALVNLVLGEKLAPEFIQEDATPDRIYDQLERYWNDEELMFETHKKLKPLPGLLHGSGASQRAAKLLGQFL
jgi:lipid-A-disaccharide synthase